MQGLAAHDAIEEAEHRGAAAARLSSSPKAAARLTARPREPEAHGPSAIERELGEGLHLERNAQHGHPGVDCRSLPASHAHRLPAYNEVRGVLRPEEEEKEAPLLVAMQEGAADQPAAEEGRTA
ncbi:hypothetical protein ABPG75_003130 [Micractinium tetrahymenae]